MLLTAPARAAALVAAAAAIVAGAPPAVGEPADPEQPLDAGRVDVAAISLVDGAMRLEDPGALVYTTEAAPGGVEVGWDTSEIGAGEVFGDSVTLRLRAAEGPAEFRAEPLRLPVGELGVTTWTFPEAGRYTLTFAVEGNLLSGEPVGTEERYTVEARQAPVDAPAPPSAASATPLAAPEVKALPQPVRATPGRVVLDEGHVDAVAPRLLDGKLQIQVKDGTTVGQSGGRVHWREPRDVVFHVKTAARTALPDDAGLAFLGRPRDEIFLLPQQQQAGLLWTGWSTEELHADQVTRPVTWRLTKVDGPGAFGIFTTGSFGASTVLFNSTDGLPDTHPVALGTHAHANWGFAKEGVYRLTFDTVATLSDGRTVSDTEVYTFTVGAAEPNDAAPGGGTGGGTGGGGAASEDNPGLASTGVSGVLPLTAGGALLVVLGGVAVVVARRRGELVAR